MGSLENGLPLKRDFRSLRSSERSNSSNGLFSQRPRSRFARFVFFRKIDYLQWICTVAVFFFVVFLFQIFFLPGSVVEEEKSQKDFDYGDFKFLNELDFGEGVKFEPSNLLAKFQKDARELNGTIALRKSVGFGYRKPKLALVFLDLRVDPYQIQMVTFASALVEIGYEIEVFSLEDGPVGAVWRDIGLPPSVIGTNETVKCTVDWLNYNGILVNSLKAVGIFSCLMQEPFRHVPLVWTIHEQILAARLRQYASSGETELVNNWRKIFNRATVVVYPDYITPMAYSACDSGNYIVIPGSPKEAWEADNILDLHKDSLRTKLEYGPDDFVVAIVGSQFMYKSLWLEHALVLQALYPVFQNFQNAGNLNSHLKIIILTGDLAGNYSTAVETIALNLRYPNETVKHVAVDEDSDNALRSADLVIYGSFLEEQSFPSVLQKAMLLGKAVIAPDLSMIRKYIDDRVNGFLFPKEEMRLLTQLMFQIISNGKLSLLALNAASIGKNTARNLMVTESKAGYISLLENILIFPSEVSLPKMTKEIGTKLKAEWEWHLFDAVTDKHSQNRTSSIQNALDKVERQFNHSHLENSMSLVTTNDTFLYSIWEEQKQIEMAYARKKREDDELKDRTEQTRGSWDEVYRNARRVDRTLHERDEGELERTGQPLCIYEPYFGEGTWPFLHRTSLYRGLGLTTKGRRPGADDVDLPSRLPILSNHYYRDVLGEYGAFFAIANHIDRIHRNAWIGFQSWRATARKVSLSKSAERSLLNAIESRRHGDSLYFWARLDMDQRNPMKQDFWSFCDSINAGNCRLAFSETLKNMYGIKHNLSSLPTMPKVKDSWSVMHCWAMPTRSFLEFVMFSRMFVNALDAQFCDDHQKTGRCYLSLSKDRHCYSRLLELLVNVWAYHSARRMVYVDPNTGVMQEQHGLKSRRGKMWVKWFQYSTLKSMDEELAEEVDVDRPKRRWLWPSTGEVFWQGMYEKERSLRNKEKEKKRQKSKDKIRRIRNRTHQKSIGKYLKPVLKEMEANSTALA